MTRLLPCSSARIRRPIGVTRRHRSLWLQQALDDENDEDAPSLEGTITADVCIIGGGYTGLWTALHLLDHDPSVSVVIVEADLCGGGASGRNGGFVLSWWDQIETLIRRVGPVEALQLARASTQAIADLGAFCAREHVDAHFRQDGWLWTATSQAGLTAWDGVLHSCARLGEQPFRVLDRAELAGRTGSPRHLGGILDPQGATVHPALLARGLRRVALRRGVRIFERSPMRTLDRQQGIVHTARGAVRAGAIVLAMNAWLAGIGELRRSIVPLSSDIVATTPMPEQLAQSGWTGGESISDSRLMVRYYRTTHDGRIVFGRGGGAIAFGGHIGAGFNSHPGRAQHVMRDLRRLVPATHDVDITHHWSGAVDRSVDGLPFFGRLAARCPIFYGAGFSGNGVAPSLIAGRILASNALGRDDAWSTCGLNRGIPGRFPPEPLRYIGGLAIRGAVSRKEEREEEGQPVGPLTRGLAALAPGH